ncbi:histidine kinase [Actinoallomurus iriomotensis]|uniref:histidine kinase n=1 Tax=Actinoallomurus iriomotensis TaxID=478107 RepID=A0A9W6RJD4_9ACTN|nr:histidine kinase [Actinoallomurus iriomotensis]GLY76783.1 two-component sensor histidine kinase [Actinoallomurus iriomotensis]
MSGTEAPRPDYPWLLPALLANGEEDRVRRSARDWVIDVLCFLLASGFGACMVYVTGHGVHPAPHPPRMPDVILGAASCLLLWWRRRWPVPIALALAVFGALSVTSIGAAAILVFTVAVHRRFRTVALVAAAHIASGGVYAVLYPDPNESYWVGLLWTVIVIGAVVAWGMFVRARRQLVLSLRDRAVRAESEQQLRVEQARHQERARIAREMHDVLAHRISLLSVHAGALEFRPDAPSEEIAQAAGVIRASAHQALQDLREVIGVLRDDASDGAPERPQPSLTDLPALIDESRRAGMAVRWENRIRDVTKVPANIGRSAYRTVQEGLTNARKHAPGAAVQVMVDGAAGTGLTVEVRNPMVKAAPEIPGAGAGLIGLTERATLAGGRLEHGRTRQGDFRVHAWLPWPAA